MMRTVEVFIVIVIILGAYGLTSYYAVLPGPREVSPMNLRRLALTTLETLDESHDLSMTVFDLNNNTRVTNLQVALAASLPTNVIYNLTVYNVNSQTANGGQLYSPLGSFSNAADLGTASQVSTYMTASSNVTYNVSPEKIGENGEGGTLYILNCSDANGWWITGYTAQSLAQDLYNILSPYFLKTVMVQDTVQLRQLLDGQKLTGAAEERVQNAVVINTFGECVPMPSEYYSGQSRSSQGYDAANGVYSIYCHTLGNLTRVYNWTWASIVGYPFYYVSNNGVFANQQNGWGIYGMSQTSVAGVRAYLQGLDNQPYAYNSNGVASEVGLVYLNQTVANLCNYYGIYPSQSQTSTRALSILTGYNLRVGLYVFDPVGGYIPGAVYNHVSSGSPNTTGSLLAIGLTRIPDIRVTALSLLSYYQPRLFASDYTSYDTSRLVVLQLGLTGGS
jgi:hypothetical protein